MARGNLPFGLGSAGEAPAVGGNIVAPRMVGTQSAAGSADAQSSEKHH